MKNNSVRVRFAPSPTGPLHIGGVRTALYNYLFAKKNNGRLVLRIEDTDRNRFIPGAEAYIMESLAWCGIGFDEDIIQGGPFAPYRQSERTSIYRQYIQFLLDQGHAYYAFDTPDDLVKARSSNSLNGSDKFQYDYKTRTSLRNSLSLSPGEVTDLLVKNVPYVIRMRIPENEEVVFHDLIRGVVHVHTENLDDKVLFKSDGLPTYHLANVVDDYLMKITHVIRGEEWLPSAPMHLLLYRFLGWEAEMPLFAHLPLILKPEGTGKLSKRDGDRLGFPVFPIQWTDPTTGESYKGYREEGYLPAAFINMLCLLGWNPGTEQEIFSINELCTLFSLERIVKHGSRFDPEKSKWFNHQYINGLPEAELVDFLEKQVLFHGFRSSREVYTSIVRIIRDRIKLIPDLWEQSWFFFKKPDIYDNQLINKIWNSGTISIIVAFHEEVQQLSVFSKDCLRDLVEDFSLRHRIKPGQLLNPLRLLLVGSNQGPGIMDIAAILGKTEFFNRIEIGLRAINLP